MPHIAPVGSFSSSFCIVIEHLFLLRNFSQRSLANPRRTRQLVKNFRFLQICIFKTVYLYSILLDYCYWVFRLSTLPLLEACCVRSASWSASILTLCRPVATTLGPYIYNSYLALKIAPRRSSVCRGKNLVRWSCTGQLEISIAV